jgi:methionyl-tRNA formyltransferase
MMSKNARIVVLTSHVPVYRLFADWAAKHEHHIVLALTPPGSADRYGSGDLAQELGKEVGLLVSGKLRTVAAPVIAALAPDLVISAAFPRLIPSEILDIPTHGALNLHPSVLPVGRGPNPMRLVYEGAQTIGATLHRTEADFDTGAILSQREQALPEKMSGPDLMETWLSIFADVIEEGTAKALAGDPGIPQDSTRASYAPMFSAEEKVIDFSEPAAVICRKVAALNVLGPLATLRLPDREGTVRHAEPVAADGGGAPGTILADHGDGWTVQAADRAVRVVML